MTRALASVAGVALLFVASLPAPSLGSGFDIEGLPQANALPSVVAGVLFARLGGIPGPDTQAAFRGLDVLAVPLQQRLSQTLAAFLTFEAAARVQAPPEVIDGSRLVLLNRALALGDALAKQPGQETGPVFRFAPVLAVDLAGEDSEYDEDFVLILDVGGNDVYRNNAGGAPVRSPLLLGIPGSSLEVLPVAALIDFSGDDQYVGGRHCVNGGGCAEASGFLLDLDGNDAYTGRSGANGGSRLGSGFLIDLAGSDAYVADGDGTNGGSSMGRGALVDLGGDDRYHVLSGNGVNGGVHMVLCVCNHLIFYQYSVAAGAQGLLYDAAGSDTYEEGPFVCGDCSVVPKGVVGAQLDDPIVLNPPIPSEGPSWLATLLASLCRDHHLCGS